MDSFSGPTFFGLPRLLDIGVPTPSLGAMQVIVGTGTLLDSQWMYLFQTTVYCHSTRTFSGLSVSHQEAPHRDKSLRWPAKSGAPSGSSLQNRSPSQFVKNPHGHRTMRDVCHCLMHSLCCADSNIISGACRTLVKASTSTTALALLSWHASLRALPSDTAM
jgi:hypothetical protein